MEKQKKFSLKNYLYEYKWWYVFGIAILLCVDLANIYIPQFIGDIIDGLTNETLTKAGIPMMLMKILIAGLIMMFGRFGWRYCIFGASRKIEYRLRNDMFGHLEKWRPVKEILDFSDEGTSIFREKPLAEKTMERIYAGLIKFVAGGKDAFLIKYNSMSRTGKYNAPGIDEPCPVVATQNRLGVAQVCFLSKQFSGHPESKNVSINEPAGTITCKDHHAFVSAHYGNGFNRSINEPSATVTTKDRFSLVSPYFIDQQYGNSKPSSTEKPLGCITANPKYNLVSCKPWIMNTNFSNVGSSIEDPAQTITANRKWHYLMNPQFNSAGGSIDNPCFTLIARMDKMPPYLVATETGRVAIEIYDTDSPMTKKIKEFMGLYGIVDIKMRMLRIPELKRIMGFPENYVLIGTQADQKKFIGNAVEVTMARVLCEAVSKKLRELRKVAA